MEKIIVKRARIGRGVFAARDIKRGEYITSFVGVKYHFNRPPFIESEHLRNHAVQIGPDTWIESSASTARYLNHSCDPNCGISGLTKLVAIRDIAKGEELTWDYSTTEDADWTWGCRCTSTNCRGTIGPWSLLPKATKEKYLKMGIVSKWIVKRLI